MNIPGTPPSTPLRLAVLISLALAASLSPLSFAQQDNTASAVGATDESRTKAPPLLLANVLHDEIDVSDYWVSEKYDGTRAVWDGKVLRFRSGREVYAPAWFLQRLPKVPLDGELWMGRGKFNATSAAVRRQIPMDDEWRQIQYMVFESPNMPGTFTQRIARIEQIVAESKFAQLKAVTHKRVKNRAELDAWLKQAVKEGAEGLMLHKADALYMTGRSDNLLKYKPELDAEGTVIAIIPGKGKNEGMMGALELQLADGKIFRLGTGFSDADRAKPPPVGSRVTFTYRELTPSGLPRFASFLRVRTEQ